MRTVLVYGLRNVECLNDNYFQVVVPKLSFWGETELKRLYRVLLAAFLIFLSGCSQITQLPTAHNGHLDLDQWDFDKFGPVRLDGQWEFYWEQLLDPDVLNSTDASKIPGYLPIPGLWQKNIVNGKPLSAKGYATYRLKVSNIKAPLPDTIYITSALSVFSLYVNGVDIGTGGRIGRDNESEHPLKHTFIARFSPGAESLDIILQVSNFHNIQGGVNTPVWLGSNAQVSRMATRSWITTGILGGALLIMGCYHLILYGLRRQEPVNLYFGLFCALWALQTLFGVNGGCLMAELFPSLPWRLSIDMTLLPYGLTTPLMVMFYHAMFRNRHTKKINLFYQLMGGIYISYIVLTPPNAFDGRVLFFVITSFSAILYLFFMFVTDLVRKNRDVIFLIPGYAILLMTGVNDLLHDTHRIDSVNLIPFGMLCFILFYSFLISYRFSKAFSTVEGLSLELKDKNRELEKLDQLKDEFLAKTSHELKTPLNGIIGIAQSLKDTTGVTRVSNSISLIVSSGTRLLSLINDLLDFSTLKNKELSLQAKPVNLRVLSDTVIQLSVSLLNEKDVVLENQIKQDFPNVFGDQNRIRQILFNLIGNAIKFTHKGQIVIRASEQDEFARIEVKDTGIGIPAGQIETIFKSFEQAQGQEGENSGGAGLGLSIAKELVELHGGTIGVTSQEDVGSTFWFTLPLAGDDLHAETGLKAAPDSDEPGRFQVSGVFPDVISRSGRPPKSDGSRPVIMAVDDDPVNLQVVINHLDAESCHTLAFSGARQALEAMNTGTIPDLVLMDVMMPGMNGYECCREIRKNHSASQLPVIMLTARDRTKDIVEGFGAGANDYLAKPFFKDELMARINTQLQLKAAYKTARENLELKKELDIRERRELRLKLVQRRLSGMLDRIKAPVLAVSPAREIWFCNRAFETLTGHMAASVLNTGLLTLFGEKEKGQIEACLKKAEQQEDDSVGLTCTDILISCADKPPIAADIDISLLDLEEETVLFLVFTPANENKDTGSDRWEVSRLVRDLGLNRERVEAFESALNRITGQSGDTTGKPMDLTAADQLLNNLMNNSAGEDAKQTRRCLAVKVMNAACDYWIAATRTSRVELADQSGLWNVYIEKDGWARTQTLDKYFSEDTLPVRPRWKNVVYTADFVLAACDQKTQMRELLETELARLKFLL